VPNDHRGMNSSLKTAWERALAAAAGALAAAGGILPPAELAELRARLTAEQAALKLALA
jgi:hypothetical protein